MKRTLGALAGLTLSVVGTGCSMCQNPFDYSRPVNGHYDSPYYGHDVREGSAISGGGAPVISQGVETASPAAAGQPTPAKSTTR